MIAGKNLTKNVLKHQRSKEIWSFLKPSNSATQFDQEVVNVEVLMTDILVHHNLPLATFVPYLSKFAW